MRSLSGSTIEAGRILSPGYSLEGLMLKLKLQYFGHLMQRADSLENTLMLRKIEGRRRRKWQPTPVFLLEDPRDGGGWWAAVYGVTQSRTRLKRLSSSSRFVIAFLPRSKCLLNSWLQSPSAVILETKKISLSLFPHGFAME